MSLPVKVRPSMVCHSISMVENAENQVRASIIVRLGSRLKSKSFFSSGLSGTISQPWNIIGGIAAS